MGLLLVLTFGVTFVLAMKDRRTLQLPNWITLPLAALVTAVALFPHYNFLTAANLVGGIAWWGLPMALKATFGKRVAAAAGDQKLGLSLGTVATMNAGWGIFIAWAVSGAWTAVVEAKLGRRDKQKIPHSPGMLVGTGLAWILTALPM